ncbi:hypothetical protein NQ314_005554 [Rhamnusium bicolor]|uniref:Peptidase S1 domain-containing protein n=1 Tax=Rhamnusium bicolor TaxID=1586634 RepID=A0AAV8ZIV6_9CUCU|nr:hypothetical protein NQ314_005554 [Rhamnusium bicolor]
MLKQFVQKEESKRKPQPLLANFLTSNELSTTAMPNINANNIGHSGGTFVRPGGGGPSINNKNQDDDFFLNFATAKKPNRNALNSACGVVIKQPRPLITHGQATHEGEFPWHVALYYAKGVDLSYTCGGSLITTYHVITVAHCVTKTKSQTTLSPDSLVVYLGKYYLKTWSSSAIQDKHVEKIIVHPNYSSQTYSNDLAILKLTTAADITDYVRPICLWEDQTSLEAVIGKQGTVAGWGFDENGKITEELTKAHMPVASQETCIYSFPDFYSRFSSERTFCAGFRNGKNIIRTSVCNGDSGGGMIFPKAGSDSNNPVWQIRGLVSISVALQDTFKCDSKHYVVFTDIAKYLDWIKNALTL